jgi:small-conductance mechanosensitive channel
MGSPGGGESVEELERREDVRVALQQISGEPAEKEPVRAIHLAWLATYLLVLAGLAVVYYLLRFDVFPLSPRLDAFLRRLTLGGMAVVAVLTIAKALDALVLSRLEDRVTAYTLRRVTRAVAALVILVVVASILSASWYTAIVSLGILSLILGFALQTPILSFIGWLYILVRSPYRVGDRIRIGEATGDVIDVGYLDTTLWEFGGEYLSTDHPSGRVIKFPNSLVLSEPVYSYSWPLFPYIWNELTFEVAYESDLEFVARTLKEVADREVGEAMQERVRTFRSVLAKTPVDELEVREEPAVFFRPSPNTWVQATVRYLVEPREGGRVKNRILTAALERLNAEPERVLFPKSNMR